MRFFFGLISSFCLIASFAASGANNNLWGAVYLFTAGFFAFIMLGLED